MAIHFKLGSRSTTSALNDSLASSSKAPFSSCGSSKQHNMASVAEDSPPRDDDAGGQSAFDNEAGDSSVQYKVSALYLLYI